MHFVTIYILFILKCFSIRVWVPERDKRLTKEVFICTAVQIILWLFAQVHCRAAFTLSSRLPLFVYTLQLTVLYVAGGDAMLTGEDEGETNTNSLVVQ